MKWCVGLPRPPGVAMAAGRCGGRPGQGAPEPPGRTCLLREVQTLPCRGSSRERDQPLPGHRGAVMLELDVETVIPLVCRSIVTGHNKGHLQDRVPEAENRGSLYTRPLGLGSGLRVRSPLCARI